MADPIPHSPDVAKPVSSPDVVKVGSASSPKEKIMDTPVTGETKPPSKETPKVDINKPPDEQTKEANKAKVTQLEAIAAGTPVTEATTPKETLPDRETVTKLLEESNALLLELKDPRLIVNSIAQQAADTPLGNEVRLDALRSLAKIEIENLPPEQAAQVNALQEKIKALALPDANPAESATLALVAKYNEQFPGKAVPEAVVSQIRQGNKNSITAVSQMLQSNPEFSQMAWKELTGQDNFTPLRHSPSVMLDLAGIPKTPENMAKAAEIFGVTKQMKESGSFGQNIIMGAMYGALGLMFFSQVALGEQGGGH